MRAVTIPIVMLLSIATCGLAAAQDAMRGQALAERWCANCHVTDRSGTSTVQQGPPSFSSIGLTSDQLRTFLTHPHGAMPDFALSRNEIEDVIAYIETLRQ